MRDVPFTRSLPARLLFRRRAMRRDWEERARRDARFYVYRDAAGSEAEFAASGRRDVEERILRGIELPEGAVAVEIGCGVGRLARALAGKVSRLYACDISDEMLRKAREFCAGAGDVEFLRTDRGLGGVPDACADLVYSHLVFQHVPLRRDILDDFAEAFRVLKPGGVFRGNVDGRSGQWFRRFLADSWSGVVFSDRGLRRSLARAGFSEVETSGAGTQYLWFTARKIGRRM